MAVDAALALTRLRQGAFVLEANTGTFVTATASHMVTPMFNLKIVPTIEDVEIPERRGTLTQQVQKFGARWGKATFESEMYGSGTTKTLPYWGTNLLLTSGFAFAGASGLLTPATGSQATCSLSNFLPNGMDQALAGCMCNWTLPLRRGAAARFAWEVEGAWQQPKAVTAPAPVTYDASVVAPTVGLTTFTIGTHSVVVPDVTIKCTNDLVKRQDVAGVDRDGNFTGYRAAAIARRKITISCAPEALAQATHNFQADFLAHTTLAFAGTVGATAGNIFTFTAPHLQLIKSPVDGDRDGLQTDELEFLCTTGAATDDEFSISFL